MHKASKFASIALLSLSLGATTLTTLQPTGSNIAMAKKHKPANRVISYTSLHGTTPYNANGGRLYSNANLTGKSRNAGNYVQTTFYAFKSAKVKKSNGKSSIYYYVENSAGNLKGWIWHGNLSEQKSYDQEKADIRALTAIVRTMSPDSQDDILDYVTNISPDAAYSDGNTKDKYDLGSVISEMGVDAYNSGEKADIQAVGQAYMLFKDRFDDLTNSNLAVLYQRYTEAIKAHDADDAAWNLGDTLATAVYNLQ